MRNAIFHWLFGLVFRILMFFLPVWLIVFVVLIDKSFNSLGADSFWAITIVFCTVVICFRLPNIYYSFSSTQWPYTYYKIINSRIDYYCFNGGENPHQYNVCFDLEYDVKGVSYTLPKDVLNPSSFNTKSDASRFLEEISTKTDAKVYYHPEKHHISYVRTGVAVSDWALVVMYGIFMIMAFERLI